MAESSIRELSFDEGLELLALARVGRLAWVDDEGIQLMPINYVSDRDAVYFRTQDDSRLAALASSPTDVAFEADFRDDLYQSGWNVTIHGSTFAPGADELAALDSQPNPWAPGERHVNVGIRIERVQGRRVRGAS